MSAAPSANERHFLERIDALVLGEARRGGASFSDLMLRLPAIYPTEVIAALDRLVAAGRLPQQLDELFHRQAHQRLPQMRKARSFLPVPHPLDYEWRFTPDTGRVLLDRATTLTPRGGDILLFGTPGVAVESLTLPTFRRLAFLAETML